MHIHLANGAEEVKNIMYPYAYLNTYFIITIATEIHEKKISGRILLIHLKYPKIGNYFQNNKNNKCVFFS